MYLWHHRCLYLRNTCTVAPVLVILSRLPFYIKKKIKQVGHIHKVQLGAEPTQTASCHSGIHLQLCKQNPRSTNIFTLTVSPACYLIFPFLPPCVQIRGPPRRHARHWIFPCFCLRKEVYMFHYGAQLGWRVRFFQLEESY